MDITSQYADQALEVLLSILSLLKLQNSEDVFDIWNKFMQVFIIKLIYPPNVQIQEETLVKTYEEFKHCVCQPPFAEIAIQEAKNIIDFTLEWL